MHRHHPPTAWRFSVRGNHVGAPRPLLPSLPRPLIISPPPAPPAIAPLPCPLPFHLIHLLALLRRGQQIHPPIRLPTHRPLLIRLLTYPPTRQQIVLQIQAPARLRSPPRRHQL